MQYHSTYSSKSNTYTQMIGVEGGPCLQRLQVWNQSLKEINVCLINNNRVYSLLCVYPYLGFQSYILYLKYKIKSTLEQGSTLS